MPYRIAPDRSSLYVWLLLVVLGTFLMIVGWVRWARGAIFALMLAAPAS